MALDVMAFPPYSVIEITDTAKGFRKLALVTYDGERYYDLLDPPACVVAYPIFAALRPEDVGDIADWIMELVDRVSDDELRRIEVCVRELERKGMDLLTYLRAARWLVSNCSTDVREAMHKGLEASAQVRGMRERQIAVASLVM
jgi:hypothetical protein